MSIKIINIGKTGLLGLFWSKHLKKRFAICTRYGECVLVSEVVFIQRSAKD